ncbi:MAG: phytoene/squalene synthase family protein [Candidatus Krumholzibacteria bacterium]|nr:phytoene/squalene synthase family protein [Candidatus Krumholzibacteria bacterium]
MDDQMSKDWLWCEAMLPQVSRTFALCIRFLPEDVRRPVLLSYLLCRVADTIEDAPEIAPPVKQQLLDLLARSLDSGACDWTPVASALRDRDDADARLAARAATVVALLQRQPPAVRAAVTTWVTEMCAGMAEFASRTGFPAGGSGMGRGLENEHDLDRYCYFVAGTVGHLLTGVFAALRPRVEHAAPRMDALAEDFGAGLQLVNILADVARDRQRGVCYIPESVCRAAGIAAHDLLRPEHRDRAREALGYLATRARQRLRRAREYCLLVPRAEYQLRLFCLIPYYLALRTLRALEQDASYPAPDQRVKIGRSAVYRTVAAARVCAASNHLLRVYAWRLELSV